MFYKGINGEPMSQDKIDAYLNRIEIEAPDALDLEYLTQLQMAHITHIPFENLDIMAGKLLSLDRETLYQRVIEGGRGGVCSELNTLYNWLLESLGFDVVSYTSRIIAKALPIQAQSHRILGVRLEGETFLTDVGFNYEHHRIPLHLVHGQIQSDGECEYRLEQDPCWGWLMWQNRPGYGWRKKLSFTEEPHIDLDFVPATFFAQAHPDSRINKATKVSLYIDGRFFAIRAGNFLMERGGVEEIIEPITSHEQEHRILKEVFHLSVNPD